MSIGALGWTFEALCVETATGYHRVNIKKSLAQLEVEGVVVSSRERRPGFNVRALTIVESFPAREELLALLKACVELWPGFAASVYAAMERLAPRTKEHLLRRKLQDRDPWGPPKPGKDLASLKLQKRKAEVLDEYLTVAEQLGIFPSTADLAENTRLIQRITACWGKFSAFCDETGVTPHYKRRSNDETAIYTEPRRLSVKAVLKLDAAIKTEEQRTCVLRYRELNDAHGKALTSNELMATDSSLYNSIRANFGTFADFRQSARSPGKPTGRYSKPSPHLRQRCIRQYADLTSLLGETPNTSTVQRESPSLYGYIRIQWGTFAEFCVDTGVSPAGHQRSMNAGYDIWRKRCIDEYADLTVKLGFPPTSRQLQAHSNGLYKRVRKIWGGFGPFRAEIGVPAVTRGAYNDNKRRAVLHGVAPL